jgi:glycosyltransferase involved in cell wall biosynthesis
VVVDDNSQDNTVDIAKKYADKVLSNKMKIEGRHRNWAYQQTKNEWVLSLDADEQVTEELKKEINEVLPLTDCVCFTIPMRNFIGSYWVRFGGWYPAAKVRLFRKNKFRYEEVEVHPRGFTDGKCGHLKNDIIHRGYPDLEHFLSSVNRQTTLEAKKWINTNRKMSLGKALWRTIDRFFRTFIGKKGYKDGMIGFSIALFAALYQILSYIKYWQMKRETNIKERRDE